MSQRIAKCYLFDNRLRDSLTFSDPTKIRLSQEDRRLQLKQTGTERATGLPTYPTDDDLYVTIAETNPLALRSWVGFGAIPRSGEQPSGTSVGYKLNNGTNDYYWDGASWTVAGASDWSTEAEVSTNIATFPASSQKLSLKINLKTTDELATPTIEQIDLLMDCNMEYMYSLLAGSLMQEIREQIRPITALALRAPGGIIVSLQVLEIPYNILSIQAVYNVTDDPSRTTNLLSAYDSTTRNITLTGSVDRGKKLLIEYQVEPEVYLNFASQDYLEVERIPAVVLDSFTIEGSEVAGLQCVVDEAAQTASVRRMPFRLHFEFEVLLLAESNRTLFALVDKALEFAVTSQLLRWRDVDELVSLKVIEESRYTGRANLTDIHQSSFTMRLEDIHFWLRPEEVLPLVQQLQLTLLTPDLQGGARWTGAKKPSP